MSQEKRIEKEANLRVSLVIAFVMICILLVSGWAFTKLAQKTAKNNAENFIN